MQTIFASIIAFITTNIDDIFILVLFFSDLKLKNRNVILGQYLGIGTLIVLSFIGSFVGLFIDIKYIGLLGIIPIYIGIKSLVALRNQNADETEIALKAGHSGNHIQQTLSVASITVANGGDNISIYIPLYATLTNSGKVTMTVIFLIMTAVWCLIAGYLSNHPAVKRSIEKYGHILTPFVFILLGIYILYESNTLDLFLGD